MNRLCWKESWRAAPGEQCHDKRVRRRLEAILLAQHPHPTSWHKDTVFAMLQVIIVACL